MAAGDEVITVRGAIPAGALGLTLVHEHLFSSFGSDPVEPGRYDTEALLQAVVPYAKKVKELGAQAIVDCTAAWFGREPTLLRRISEAAGLHILTNTGYYAAANDRYVPPSARDETPEQIAAHWAKEFRDGIGTTGIRPGHIKIGVDAGALSEIDRKIVMAAAKTHRATGLVVTSHTSGSAEGAREQIALFRKEGVSPQAWIWAHANQCTDGAALVEAAKSGAWLSLDGIAPDTVDRHLELLRNDVIRERALLSHDGNSFRIGRAMKPYDALFTHLLPKLKAEFPAAVVRRLTVENAARAFAIKPRLL
jgi:phosphotriesterase-related protein